MSEPATHLIRIVIRDSDSVPAYMLRGHRNALTSAEFGALVLDVEKWRRDRAKQDARSSGVRTAKRSG